MDDKGTFTGLYALLDESLFQGRDPVALARAAVSGGACAVQLRLKSTPDRQALALARALKPFVPTLIVNDRVDLALLAGCGVHLGAEDLPVAEARRLLGAHARIGATCRTLADIEQAKRDGADHVGLGPVFASGTKPLPHALLGVKGLEAIARASPLPIVAISGITLENVGAVAKTGVACAAIGSGLFNAEDIEARARMMLNAWGR
jgi:thiamine-phosphate pyrophosphorylase